MKSYSKREAFTLLEIIMVIVVLGIVASIGSQLIADVYKRYVIQRAIHNASSKSDIASKQIAARLANRLSEATIGRKADGTYRPITELPENNISTTTDDFVIVEWIGYDNDSFSTAAKPGWSGVCDIWKEVNATAKGLIHTPGSDLNLAQLIIFNLGGSITDAAVVFNGEFYGAGVRYYPAYMGFGTASHDATFGYTTLANNTISPVSAFPSSTSISLGDTTNAKLLEDKYRLVWSAYAIVPENQRSVNGVDLFDLYLYYDYQPWSGASVGGVGETYGADGKRKLLVENVTTFKFKAVGDTIRFKICVQEQMGDNFSANICKEKAVIR